MEDEKELAENGVKYFSLLYMLYILMTQNFGQYFHVHGRYVLKNFESGVLCSILTRFE